MKIDIKEWTKRVARGDYLGGYIHYVLMSDGGLLCGPCVRENYREIAWARRYQDKSSGWLPVGIVTDGDFDSDPEWCAHCGKQLYDGMED